MIPFWFVQWHRWLLTGCKGRLSSWMSSETEVLITKLITSWVAQWNGWICMNLLDEFVSGGLICCFWTSLKQRSHRANDHERVSTRATAGGGLDTDGFAGEHVESSVMFRKPWEEEISACKAVNWHIDESFMRKICPFEFKCGAPAWGDVGFPLNENLFEDC